MTNKADILSRYALRQVSPEEEEAFQEWMQTLDQQALDALMDEYAAIVAALPDLDTRGNPELLRSIHQEIAMKELEEEPYIPRIPFWRSWRAAAAAVIILALSATTFLIFRNKDDEQVAEKKPTPAKEISPGKSGAILTLVDGTQMVLDSMGNGPLTTQGGTAVSMEDGQLKYMLTDTKAEDVVYNTMTTSRGRQFEITLPDGTHVWLNAASSIRYPTRFTGNERKVTISGEAYFEVAADKRKPFLVDIDNKATVEVLGTHFNINAYSDERNVQTTLLEGSIKIRNNKQWILLKPSQQVVLENGTMQLIEDADINIIMAWKNGSFRFRNTPLQDVLRQLSRWYDVEVSYQQHVPQMAFTGAIKRNLALSEALRVLEVLGVNFSIEGKHLIVKPPAS